LAEKHTQFWYPRSTVVGTGEGALVGDGVGALDG